MELEMLNWLKFDLYNISLSKSQTAYSLIYTTFLCLISINNKIAEGYPIRRIFLVRLARMIKEIKYIHRTKKPHFGNDH